MPFARRHGIVGSLECIGISSLDKAEDVALHTGREIDDEAIPHVLRRTYDGCADVVVVLKKNRKGRGPFPTTSNL
eukprot:5584779-Amphidinium_carterae.3